MNLCKYGCGNPGTIECKGYYNRGQYRCSISANTCPAMKDKNKAGQPYNDPVKKATIVEKIITTTEAKYAGGWKEHGAKSKAARLANNPSTYQDAANAGAKTNVLRYGVKSVFERQDIKDQKIKTNMKRYGVPYQVLRPEFRLLTTTRAQEKEFCKIKSAFDAIVFDGSDADKAQYYRATTKLTRAVIKSLSLHPRKNFELDHKYSIITGYVNKVPPEFIASHHNLEFILASINNKKKSKCSVSLEWLTEQCLAEPLDTILVGHTKLRNQLRDRRIETSDV